MANNNLSPNARKAYIVLIVVGVLLGISGSVVTAIAKDQEIARWFGIPLCQAYSTVSGPPISGSDAKFVSRDLGTDSSALCPSPSSLGDPSAAGAAEWVNYSIPLSLFRKKEEYYAAVMRSDNSRGKVVAKIGEGAEAVEVDLSIADTSVAVLETDVRRVSFEGGIAAPITAAAGGRKLLKGSSTSSSKTNGGRTVSSSTSSGRSYQSRRGGYSSRYSTSSPTSTRYGRTGRTATRVGTYVFMTRRGGYRTSYYHRGRTTETSKESDKCVGTGSGCDYELQSSVTRDEFSNSPFVPANLAGSASTVDISVRAESFTWPDAKLVNGTARLAPELFITFATDSSGRKKSIGSALVPLGLIFAIIGAMGLMVPNFPMCFAGSDPTNPTGPNSGPQQQQHHQNYPLEQEMQHTQSVGPPPPGWDQGQQNAQFYDPQYPPQQEKGYGQDYSQQQQYAYSQQQQQYAYSQQQQYGYSQQQQQQQQQQYAYSQQQQQQQYGYGGESSSQRPNNYS